MTSIRKALGWSFIEKYALIVLSLVSYVLIARLLTPEQIGLYSVTAALVGIAQVLRDFGIGNYLIQERDLSRAQMESAFGFSLVTGGLMFVLTLACAPLAASFYGSAEVAAILRVICLNFLLLPFCSIALAMLRRSMRFDLLLVANLAGGAAAFVVTVGLASLGAGAESLAWGTVASNLISGICAWLALSGDSRPHRPRLIEWRAMLNYGKQSTFAGVVVTAAMDMNDLVVGKVLGFAPVAILNRALGTMNLFQRDLMGAGRNVAFPAFAAAHREGKATEPMFVYSYAVVTGLGWTFYGFLALFPLECLRLLAGAQWDAAVPYVLIFALAGAVVTTATLTQTLVLAVGRVDIASRADIVVSLLRLGTAVFAAVVFRDLLAVALAVLFSYSLAAPIFFAFKQSCLPNDWHGLWRQSQRSLAVAGVSLALPALLSLAAGLDRTLPLPLFVFLLAGLLTCVGWVIALRVCSHPIASDPIYQRLTSRFGLRPLSGKP
jgi:O-antigen/teichoic acid export membrane protein